MKSLFMSQKLVVSLVLLLVVCFAPSSARGEATCGSGDFTFLVPDGRIFTSTLPASTDFALIIAGNVSVGGLSRSYSVELIGPNSTFAGAPTLYVRSDS